MRRRLLLVVAPRLDAAEPEAVVELPQHPRRPARRCAYSEVCSGGKFVKQIGMPGKIEGADSTTTLNRPSHIEVDAAANEIYVADSGNRRVVVFDAEPAPTNVTLAPTAANPMRLSISEV